MRELNETFEIMKGIQLKKYYKASPERREGIITDPNEILIKAVHNARPLMSIQNVRVGGSVYKVPGDYYKTISVKTIYCLKYFPQILFSEKNPSTCRN